MVVLEKQGEMMEFSEYDFWAVFAIVLSVVFVQAMAGIQKCRDGWDG